MTEIANNTKTNRVLALSGGGIKGISELMVLMEIEERTGKSISELFPIISGTSVGGLIAALLTIPKEEGSTEAKYSAKEAFEIFKSSAGGIFPNVFLGSVKQIFTHKYSQKPLKELLEKYLGDNRMDSSTSRLVIPVNDLTTNDNELKIFDSLNSYSPHIRIKDVLLATTAAPTYFKPVMDKTAVQGHNYASGLPYVYADGGLNANRPANEVLKLLKQNHTREEQKQILDNTIVCAFNFSKSIDSSNSIPKIGLDGILGWLIKGKIVSRLMNNSEVSSNDEVISDLSGENEFFEVKLPITQETKSLDNASLKNIQRLEEIGHKYIEENSELIQRICDTLLDNLNKEQAFNQPEDTSDEGYESDNGEEGSLNLNTEHSIDQTEDLIYEGFEEDENEKVGNSSVNSEDKEFTDDIEKEEILLGIKKFLSEFAEKNPELKKDINHFLQKVGNYTLEEIKGCIVSFEQASLKWQEEQSMLSSCGMEALKEDIDLEGIDDEVSNHEILA